MSLRTYQVLFSIALLLCSGVCLAEPNNAGARLVEEREPSLYYAFVTQNNNDHSIANTYFEGWTEQTLLQFRQTLPQKFWREFDLNRPPRNSLVNDFEAAVFGAMAEGFMSVQMRQILSETHVSHFLTEENYRHLNPNGNKPDGMVYMILTNPGQEPILLVTRLIETKGAFASVGPQARGIRQAWIKNGGVTIGNRDAHTKFPPERILISTPTGFRSLVAWPNEAHLTATPDDFVGLVTRFSPHLTANADIREQRVIPLDPGMAHEIAKQYIRNVRDIALLSMMERGIDVNAAPTQSTARSSNRRNSTSSPTRRASPEQGLVDNPGPALNAYIKEHKSWPKSSQGERGALLARIVASHGGQATVFMEMLDNEARELVQPAMHQFERALLRYPANHQNFAHALGVFARHYPQRYPHLRQQLQSAGRFQDNNIARQCFEAVAQMAPNVTP